MKKAEIKRRKRVVPANGADDGSSVYTSDLTEEDRRSLPPGGATPPPAYLTSDSLVPTYPSPNPYPSDKKAQTRPPSGPIPVDFTSMWNRPRNSPSEEHVESQPQASIPRKRSFSAASEPGPSLYPHAQNVAPTRDDNIDPALPGQPSDPSQPSQKDVRRAELQAEAERMRQMLSAKEREIAELYADG
jgi:GATA-binding protein